MTVELGQERLKELLDYDPASGVFTWRVSRRGTAAGDEAGCPNWKGHILIGIDYKLYFAARLAWLWMTGSWPLGQVDHRDLDKSNNKWANLRAATHAQNKWNQDKRSDNTSGYKGVGFDRRRNRYFAYIGANGNHRYLGQFLTAEEANLARLAAASELHGEFAR